MHFNRSTSTTLPLPLTLLALVFALATTTTSALPTSRSAATYEPLFRPASPHVGPNRSIERLRQRRAANLGKQRPILQKRSAVVNPKTKRSSSSPVVVVPSLDRRSLGLPAIVPNPKSKRSATLPPPQRRSLISSNPKDKRTVVAASIEITPSVQRSSSFAVVSNLLKRFLGSKRTITVGALEVKAASSSSSSSSPARIPNPKSPKFTAGTSSSVAPSSTSSSQESSRPSSKPTSTVVSSVTSTSTVIKTSTTTSVVPTQSSVTWPVSGKQISGGYYPDWEGDNLPPEKINYKMFDLINFCTFLLLFLLFRFKLTDSLSIRFCSLRCPRREPQCQIRRMELWRSLEQSRQIRSRKRFESFDRNWRMDRFKVLLDFGSNCEQPKDLYWKHQEDGRSIQC